jgi:hypothetical protein
MERMSYTLTADLRKAKSLKVYLPFFTNLAHFAYVFQTEILCV